MHRDSRRYIVYMTGACIVIGLILQLLGVVK